MFNTYSVFSSATISLELHYEKMQRVYAFVLAHDGINATTLYRSISKDSVQDAIREGIVSYDVMPTTFGSTVTYTYSKDGVTCEGTRSEFIHDSMSGAVIMLLKVNHVPTAKSGKRYAFHVTAAAPALLDSMHQKYKTSAEYDISAAIGALQRISA